MYDDRVKKVADAIAPWVQFNNVNEAQQFIDSYKQPESASVPTQIRHMAEGFITYPERFGNLSKCLNANGRHERTLISTVSEAIREVARRYVSTCEALSVERETVVFV